MYSRLYFGVTSEIDCTVALHVGYTMSNDIVYCLLSFDSVPKLNNRITHPRHLTKLLFIVSRLRDTYAIDKF